jgi:ABC-type transporter Mla MlaB component
MLEISRTSTDNGRVTYALNGEVTVDQVERLEALVQAATGCGRTITFDVQHVWRIDREAAFLIADNAFRPNNKIRIVGMPAGLLEWLRSVSNERP